MLFLYFAAGNWITHSYLHTCVCRPLQLPGDQLPIAFNRCYLKSVSSHSLPFTFSSLLPLWLLSCYLQVALSSTCINISISQVHSPWHIFENSLTFGFSNQCSSLDLQALVLWPICCRSPSSTSTSCRFVAALAMLI